MTPSISAAADVGCATLQVVRMEGLVAAAVTRLLARYDIIATRVPAASNIPGSYWGESEAGLLGNRVYFRDDTPLHSMLHEACHFICMDEARRTGLDRDAGGDYSEENAVCYLQILLADHIPDFGRTRMCRDMDTWGYTFRLGSAQAWFEQDAEDARDWLLAHGVIDAQLAISWRCA